MKELAFVGVVDALQHSNCGWSKVHRLHFVVLLNSEFNIGCGESLQIVGAVGVINWTVNTEEVVVWEMIAWLAMIVVCWWFFVFMAEMTVMIVAISSAVVIVIIALAVVSRGLISAVIVSLTVCVRPIGVLGVAMAFTPSVVSIWMNWTWIRWFYSSLSLVFVALIRTTVVIVVSLFLILIWFAIAVASGIAVVASLIGVLLVVALTAVVWVRGVPFGVLVLLIHAVDDRFKV